MTDKDNVKPSIPTEDLANWLNEQADIIGNDAAALEHELLTVGEDAVSSVEQTRIERRVGSIDGRQKLLNDFKGFLISKSAEEAGKLIDVQYIEESIE